MTRQQLQPHEVSQALVEEAHVSDSLDFPAAISMQLDKYSTPRYKSGDRISLIR